MCKKIGSLRMSLSISMGSLTQEILKEDRKNALWNEVINNTEFSRWRGKALVLRRFIFTNVTYIFSLDESQEIPSHLSYKAAEGLAWIRLNIWTWRRTSCGFCCQCVLRSRSSAADRSGERPSASDRSKIKYRKLLICQMANEYVKWCCKN